MTITDTTADQVSLSALLRDGSRAEHTEAEGSSFMSELLESRISLEGYVTYLARLRPVYRALEEAAERFAGDPLAAPIIDARLNRLATIDADLAFFGADPAAHPSAAADAYAARIDGLTWAGDFVAHHYTRYLGDLSGGQAIGRILGRSFELEGDGLSFYDFTEIAKPKPYKDDYRAALDALPLADADKQRVLAEVKVAFGLNGALFDELTGELARWAR